MQTLLGLEAAMGAGWGTRAALLALLGMIAACRPPGEEPGGSAPPPAAQPDAGTAGPVPPPRGATAWVRTSDAPGHERSAGLASTGNDTLFVAEVRGLTQPYSDVGTEDVTLRIQRVDAKGETVWTRTFPVTPVEALPGDPSTREAALRAWTAAGGDRLFVAGNVRGKISGVDTGGFLLALAADGEALWARDFPHDEVLAVSGLGDGSIWLAVREHGMEPGCATGRIALLTVSAGGLVERRVHPTGAGSDCFGDTLALTSIATTKDGGVLFGGGFSGTLTLGTDTFESATYSPVLGALDAEGALVWSHAFSGVPGEVTGVASGAGGEALFSGTFRDATLRWGETTLGASGGTEQLFVLAATAARQPAWAAGLGPGERPVVAATPNGSAVVAGLSRGSGRPLLTVHQIDPGGVTAWWRAFPREEGPADLFAEALHGLVVQGENVSLTGQFSHPTDFGSGVVTPLQTDTLLLRLTP